MNSVELILLNGIPRGHPNPCSRVGLVYKIPYRRALGLAFRPSARASKGILHTSVGLSCSIFKNTSATCAWYTLYTTIRARSARSPKAENKAYQVTSRRFHHTTSKLCSTLPSLSIISQINGFKSLSIISQINLSCTEQTYWSFITNKWRQLINYITIYLIFNYCRRKTRVQW